MAETRQKEEEVGKGRWEIRVWVEEGGYATRPPAHYGATLHCTPAGPEYSVSLIAGTYVQVLTFLDIEQ
jgi:hypothetical protein